MSVQIIHDERHGVACLYCTTSDFAFGPIFNDDRTTHKDAEGRAQAFLRWFDEHPMKEAWLLGRKDVRNLNDAQMQSAYLAWLQQEAEQYRREEAAEREAAEAE